MKFLHGHFSWFFFQGYVYVYMTLAYFIQHCAYASVYRTRFQFNWVWLIVSKLFSFLCETCADDDQVRLIPYNPDYFDESVLWTESDDLGDGFHTIRMVNNTALLFDSLNSVPAAGGVRVGNPLCLWRWNQGNNQRWKIIPYCMFLLNDYIVPLLYII